MKDPLDERADQAKRSLPDDPLELLKLRKRKLLRDQQDFYSNPNRVMSGREMAEKKSIENEIAALDEEIKKEIAIKQAVEKGILVAECAAATGDEAQLQDPDKARISQRAAITRKFIKPNQFREGRLTRI